MEKETRRIGGYTISDIEREAEQSLSPVVEMFKEKSTRVQRYGQTFIFKTLEYAQPLTQSIYDLSRQIWDNFAPIRWFIYTLLTFYSIPVTILIGWAILCFAGIVALAGVGITIAEGFFVFLGMSIFLPIATILCIVAFVLVVFFTLAWIGMRSSITVYEYFNKTSNESIRRSINGKRRQE